MLACELYGFTDLTYIQVRVCYWFLLAMECLRRSNYKQQSCSETEAHERIIIQILLANKRFSVFIGVSLKNFKKISIWHFIFKQYSSCLTYNLTFGRKLAEVCMTLLVLVETVSVSSSSSEASPYNFRLKVEFPFS